MPFTITSPPTKFTKTLTDTLVLSEDFNKKTKKPFAETLVLSEDFNKKTSRSFADTLVLSEAFSKKPKLSFSETLVLAEAFSKITSRSFSDTLTLAEVFKKKTSRDFADTLVLSEVFKKKSFKSLSDTIKLSEVFAVAVAILELVYRTDINKIIDELGENVTLTTITETLDGMGNLTSTSETSDTGVTVVFDDITNKDRDLLGVGKEILGNAKLFTKWSYNLTNNGDQYVMKPGDVVKRTYYDGSNRYDATYRVEDFLSEDMMEGVVVCNNYLVKLTSFAVTADATTPSSGLEVGWRADFANIVSEIGETVQVTSVTDIVDSMGNLTGVTELTDSGVDVVITDVSAKERELTSRGISLKGRSLMYAKNNYDLTANGNDYQIKIGDEITAPSKTNSKFRVEEIISKNVIVNGPVYITYLIRRFDLS